MMAIRDRIRKKIRDIAAKPRRTAVVNQMREQLQNTSYSIISSNCMGGILNHDLGVGQNSPTMNLYFKAGDFVKFCSNMEYYLNQIPEDDVEQTRIKGYPVCRLGDLELFCVHYKTGDQVREKWISRSKRVNFDNLFIMMTDRNGLTPDMVAEMSKIPYPKVLFTSKPYPYDFVKYIDEFKNEVEVGQMQFFADFKGHRYYEKYFDIISWLNHAYDKQNQ